MPTETQTVPAKGQTWLCQDTRFPLRIVIVDVGPRRVSYHNSRKQLQSMTREALARRFQIVPTAQ